MGSRKRVKPNPASGLGTSTPTSPPSAMSSKGSSKSSQSRASRDEEGSFSPAKPNANGNETPAPGQGSKQVHKTKSWYGSWPRVPKSAASTQVARETILGGTSKPKRTADFTRFETKKTADAVSILERSPPSSAAPTMREDASSMDDRQPDPSTPPSAIQDAAKPDDEGKPAKSDDEGKPAKLDDERQSDEADVKMTDVAQENGGTEPAPVQPAEPTAKEQPPAATVSQRPASGWFGWLGRSAAVEVTEPAAASVVEPALAPEVEQGEAPPEAQAVEADKEVQPEQETPEPASTTPAAETPEPVSNTSAAENKSTAASGGSWLWFWTSRDGPTAPQPELAPQTSEPEAPPAKEPETPAAKEQEAPLAKEPEAPPAKEPEDVVMQDAPAAEAAPEEPSTPAPKAGSTWAFWSRDSRSASKKQPARKGEQGQLAVMGETSENHPENATSVEFKSSPPKEPSIKSGRKDQPNNTAATPSRESPSKSSKRSRPKSVDTDEATPARPGTPKTDATAKPSAPKTPASTTKPSPPNLLLPSFESTYKYKENPSILTQITQLLLRTEQSSTKHVYLTKEPPKIKKAIAIGVHGLFPSNYLRPMIGQPTGTSIKFANHCAEAIRRWADSHGCEDCEIEKVALEGEGKINERVENLWKLLLNWIDLIRKADFILIGCHSQGVPVSIILLAKLIELGIVSSAKVGVCAMAGVSLGPFPDYRSSMGRLMGTAAELWEFADPQSEVSKKLEASTKVILSYGARVTFVGSIDDQLVPLESAIYAPVHHPYVYRAVFIDGRIHAPNFIAHLVGFALKLRNLGVSDHGLIRELSTPLAGSLYSGEGHSRLYDDERVYDLAVTHALQTTDLPAGGTSVPCEVCHRAAAGAGGTANALSNPNPYHLPWIMRGLLEEDFVKTELSDETAELVRQFDDWKPVTKALKDVKYRLEAVRSKL